jgi:hypothetical protein
LGKYTIEEFTPLNLCALEKKCKSCIPTKPPTPTPKPKCCNKPPSCCDKGTDPPKNVDGLLCCGKGNCTHWCGGKLPNKLTYSQLAKVWKESTPKNCSPESCNSALYNAFNNSKLDPSATSLPVTGVDDNNNVGLFKLPKKSVLNSSCDKNCQLSVIHDPCKQAYLQHKILKNGCKGPNWDNPTTNDKNMLNKNNDFKKGLNVCHNI